jgi:hypothetical protein
MKKIVLLFLLLVNLVYAAQKVLLVNRNIQFKEVISSEDVIQRNTYKPLKRNCTPVTKDMIESAQFIALHYIRKNSIICTKDIEQYVRRSVKFDFGSFEVEKVGEVIQETKDFVKIKTRNGRVEKIYKDGHSR